MGKLRNNEKGFGAVEGLLIVAVVVLLSVVGYMVYKNHNKTTTASVATTTATQPAKTPAKKPAKTTTIDPYTGWQSYTLKYEKLAFKYPAGWTIQDDSGSQGLTPNTDSVNLAASDGFNISIVDGWDGGGDPPNLATDSSVQLTLLGNQAYLVFSHVKCFGHTPCDANALGSAILMLKPSSQYGQNGTVGYFPQDKNAHGDPKINNGGSTILIGAYYSGTNAKTFATVAQAQSDPEYKNAILVIQSMHY